MATLKDLDLGEAATLEYFWPRRTKSGVNGRKVVFAILSRTDITNAKIDAMRFVEDLEKKAPLKEMRREFLDNETQIQMIARALRDPDMSKKKPDGSLGDLFGPNELRGLPAEDFACLYNAYSDFEISMSPIQHGITNPGTFNDLLKKLAEEAELDPLAFVARGTRLSFQRTLASLLIDAATGKSLPTWLVSGFSSSTTPSEAESSATETPASDESA